MPSALLPPRCVSFLYFDRPQTEPKQRETRGVAGDPVRRMELGGLCGRGVDTKQRTWGFEKFESLPLLVQKASPPAHGCRGERNWATLLGLARKNCLNNDATTE